MVKNMFFSSGLERKISQLLEKTNAPSMNGNQNRRYDLFIEVLDNYNDIKNAFGSTIAKKHPETAKYRMLITALNDVELKYKHAQKEYQGKNTERKER